MGAALEGGFDLGALALCFVAIALLVVAKSIAQAIAAPFNVSIFGSHPFAGVANAIENHIVGALDDAIRGVEKVAAGFVSGLIDAFGLLIAIPALLFLGVRAALEYLWNQALMPRVHSVTDAIATNATKALNRVTALEGTVTANLGAAERYARERASSALDAAEAYVDKRIAAASSALRGDIADALSTAEAFAATAVGKLRAAEDTAIANAVGLAAAAEQAGRAAAAAALLTAEGEIAAGVTAAEAAAAGALAASDAAGKAALELVRSVAVTAEQDIATVLGDLDARRVAELIATIPAIGTLVYAIAREAGLENAECRSKVKGICGTDPSSWLTLLAGLAAVGAGFNLRELAGLANEVVRDVGGVVRELADAA